MANTSITRAIARVSSKYKERVKEILVLLDYSKDYEIHYHRNTATFKHDYSTLVNNHMGYQVVNTDTMSYSGTFVTYPTLSLTGDFVFLCVELSLYDAKSERINVENHILIYEKSERGGRTAC